MGAFAPPQPLPANAPGPQDPARVGSPGRSSRSARTRHPAALGSTATGERAEQRIGAGAEVRDAAGGTIQIRHSPQRPPMHPLYLLLPPPSPPEASPVAPPAAPPTPGGRSSSATRPALPPPEPRPLEPPSRAAGRTRRSWTDQKYGFRTKAKAREALRCLATRAPPSAASVFREGARRAAPCTSESLGHGVRIGVVGSAN